MIIPIRFALLRGIIIAVLGSLFIYLSHIGIDNPFVNTLTGMLSLYLLLGASAKTWFWSGFFFGLLWFWWIGLSFIHYQMPWMIPFVVLFIALVYGGIFWLIAKIAFSVQCSAFRDKSVAKQRIPSFNIQHSTFNILIIKALGLLMLSYVHPLGFDWFKPELMFVESYLGITKWQFALILLALVLTHWLRRPLFLLLALAAYAPDTVHISPQADTHIELVTTHTPVEAKWDTHLHPAQFAELFNIIDRAIDANRTLVILPESVFPVFLNRDPILMDALRQRAKQINIVTGGLSWDGKTPHNSAYIFTMDGKVTIANKVILVPFGEANPLPDFLSNWVNRVFYDNAVDYKASSDVVDYTIDSKTYRNAICFEATSEKLYQDSPKHMIVLSNNGWFTPSIEPTLQRILLQYYVKKYGTTIYHAVNMAPSYTIRKVRP